jgi:arylsulfatase A-like enzyme
MAQAIAHCYGVISIVDDALGRMLDALEGQGLLDNTMVVFTSDHGEHLGRHGLIGKGANLLDDLVRIPLVVSWPGRFRAQTCDAMVDLTDGFATLLDVAGSSNQPPPTSRSLVPLLEARVTDAFPDRAFFQHHGTSFLDCVRGIRTRHHKYVFRAHDMDEFYDLDAAPDETENLIDAPACQSTIDGLRQELVEWMTENQDMAARGVAARFSRRSALL